MAIAGLSLALVAAETRLLGPPLIEALVLALLIGVGARTLLESKEGALFAPGAAFAAKQVLEVSVALLGASVFLPAMARAGPTLLAPVILGVSAGIVVSFGIARALGLPPKLAALVAMGNSICGNSAIAALASVIRAEKKDVASAIGLTAVLGVGLVLLLPALIVPLALSHYQYGVLAGMSVYAVPQVVAAAFPVSQLSGEVATLVKLMRVLLLGPAVLSVGLLFRLFGAEAGGAGARFSTYAPWFVLVFLLLATVRSVGLLPDALSGAAREVSRLLTIIAMAGLGFGVDVAAVRSVGPRVAVAVIASLVFLVGLTISALRLGGIGE